MATTMLRASLAARAVASPRGAAAASASRLPVALAPRSDRALRTAFRASVAGAALRRSGGARVQATRRAGAGVARAQAAASGESSFLGVSTTTLKKARSQTQRAARSRSVSRNWWLAKRD